MSPAGAIVASYGLPLNGGGAIGNNVVYDLHTSQKDYIPEALTPLSSDLKSQIPDPQLRRSRHALVPQGTTA